MKWMNLEVINYLFIRCAWIGKWSEKFLSNVSNEFTSTNAQQQFCVHGCKSVNGLTAKAQKMVRGRTYGKHLKHPAIGNDSTDACWEQKIERCWLTHHPGTLLPRVRGLIIRFAVSSAQQKPTDSTCHRIVCGNGLAHGNCCSENGLLLVLFWFWHACIFIIERAREGFSY